MISAPPAISSTVTQRGVSFMPNFSDIFRGNFLRRDDPAEEQKSSESSREDKNASLFETVEQQAAAPAKIHAQHKYSTAVFKISRRKLNLLANQIAGKPVDSAILQMEFSDKRAARRIKSTLCLARDHAEMYKGLAREKLIVAEAWVSKGDYLQRVDPKGRGRIGRKHHPSARMSVVLKEGKTHTEILEQQRKYKLGRIVGAGFVREDKPIRNPGPGWAW
ncbi:50S ribosomal protein L22 [Rhizoctonia solani AG-1 IB]|uniref:50S ribosomal protein L22 n=2 Tax=Rhizoctonia solani TaxID=456999 RepID=A0A8H2XB13_9AGAM|nr:unnamed protein product [Rhizoctonia solani]CCO28109.1 50S ribosomal protein L22 [Rhizoctonia solani AG-1 IB]